MAKGFLQRYGVDYDETYAPVARYPSVRAIVALAAHHGFELHQMDVKSAYLHGELEEDIYMQQPVGYVMAGREQLVCKLRKALYGLKQAGRTWHTKIDIVLQRQRFTALDADHCIYVREQDACVTIIALYVDDLLIACSELAHLTRVKRALTEQFEMEDLGEASFLLGIDIRRDRARRTISLGQSAYITALLERHGMSDCKPCSTPTAKDFIATVVKPAAAVESKEADSEVPAAAGEAPTAVVAAPVAAAVVDTVDRQSAIREYQAIIGGVMFAMICTRPDIAYAVNSAGTVRQRPVAAPRPGTEASAALPARHRPSPHHLHGHRRSRLSAQADRLQRRQLGRRRWMPQRHGLRLHAGRRSHQLAERQAEDGRAVDCGGRVHGHGRGGEGGHLVALVLQRARPRHVSPYRPSLGQPGAASRWLTTLTTMPGRSTSTSAITFIRQHVADKTIVLTFVGTEDMVADIFTKPLEYVAYERGARMLGLSESSSRGGVGAAS